MFPIRSTFSFSLLFKLHAFVFISHINSSLTSSLFFCAFHPSAAQFPSDHFLNPLMMSFHSSLYVHPVLGSFLRSLRPLVPWNILLLNCIVTSLVINNHVFLIHVSLVLFFLPSSWLTYISAHSYVATSSAPFFYVTPSSPSFCSSALFHLVLLTTYTSPSLQDVVYLVWFPWHVCCRKAEGFCAFVLPRLAAVQKKKNRYYFSLKTPRRLISAWFTPHTW